MLVVVVQLELRGKFDIFFQGSMSKLLWESDVLMPVRHVCSAYGEEKMAPTAATEDPAPEQF